MLGFILVTAFCGWYMWINYLACVGLYNEDKKKGEENLTFIIFMYLWRCSWAIFLIIYGFIQVINS